MHAMSGEALVKREQPRRIMDEQVLERVLEARGVRHQMADEDRLLKRMARPVCKGFVEIAG
jgi:hypothetical protein